MAKNKGKGFESIIRECFEKVPGVSIDRIPDQTMHNKGACNICDFIVYKEPYEYYIECKSVHGNRFPLSNLSDTQYEGLLKKSEILGVSAGIICWYIDKDITIYIPINTIRIWKEQTEVKSVPFDIADIDFDIIQLEGKKRRVYFDYDMELFIKEVERRCMLRV